MRAYFDKNAALYPIVPVKVGDAWDVEDARTGAKIAQQLQSSEAFSRAAKENEAIRAAR